MQRATLALVIWGLLMIACVAPQATVPSPTFPGITATEVRVPSATAELTSTASPSIPFTQTMAASVTANAATTPAPTQMPTAQPVPAPIYPVVDKLCPPDPIVPLGNLGLDPQMRLILSPYTVESFWDEHEAGLFVVSHDHPIPQRIGRFIKAGQINSRYYNVSPNGQWIVFDRKVIGTDKTKAWVSSINGNQQWLLSPRDDLGFGMWMDNNTVVLRDSAGQPSKVVNPFTMEVDTLTDLPATQITGIGAILFRDAGHTLMIYQADNNYRLFTAGTHMDQQVLPWLSEVDIPFLDKDIYVTPKSEILVRTVRSYGFDLSPLMQAKEMLATSSYSQTMQPVFLPDEIRPARPEQFAAAGTSMSVYKSLGESIDSGSQFYWFDYEHQMIRDYCFVAHEGANPSPKGKFVAFTRQHFPSVQPVPKSVLILNLETGYIAQINDYQFVGWAQAEK